MEEVAVASTDRFSILRAALESEINRLRFARDARLLVQAQVLKDLCLPLLDLWVAQEAEPEFDPFATAGIALSSVTSLLKSLLTPEYERAPAAEVNLVIKHHIDRVFPHSNGDGCFLENSTLN